jgi:hypothetical protein
LQERLPLPEPLILLGPQDNVLIAIRDLAQGEIVTVNGAPVAHPPHRPWPQDRAVALRAGDTVVKLARPWAC